MDSLCLDKQELRELTHRKRKDSQLHALRKMGIQHIIRPDGTLAVLRDHVHSLMGGSFKADKIKNIEPNWSDING